MAINRVECDAETNAKMKANGQRMWIFGEDIIDVDGRTNRGL